MNLCTSPDLNLLPVENKLKHFISPGISGFNKHDASEFPILSAYSEQVKVILINSELPELGVILINSECP